MTYVPPKLRRGGIPSTSREAAAQNSCGRQPTESYASLARINRSRAKTLRRKGGITGVARDGDGRRTRFPSTFPNNLCALCDSARSSSARNPSPRALREPSRQARKTDLRPCPDGNTCRIRNQKPETRNHEPDSSAFGPEARRQRMTAAGVTGQMGSPELALQVDSALRRASA